MSETEIRGSCLCGDVRWTLDRPPERMTHCHCSMCRKAHGAAFATYATVPSAQFRWDAGEDRIARYRSSAELTRGFCPRCGSVVPQASADGAELDVPVGCLDDDPVTRPSAHIFAASKAPWHVIADDLRRHDEWSPDDRGPVVADPERTEPLRGVVRGSCLCGAVAFEVTTPFKAVHNCHCTRCRKARAAAHTTNGFTSAQGTRFVRGEDRIERFRLPGARMFTVTFCRACGSGVPRLDPDRDIASIPFGALDDDPGRGADDHIYVAWKAPWYEIGDDLPRHDEEPPG